MDELDLGATVRGFIAGQKIFNRYTLRNQLGRGGMGVVWRARDESLEQDVAIKMLPEIVANDPASIRELKRETSRNQMLSHPHILRVFDFVEGGHLCGITMEIAEGGTLSVRRLEQPNEHFEAEQLGAWVRQLCEALDFAHVRAKVVHRDLKPANLMLTAGGELKVTDFGIAASLSESVTRISRQAGSSGTPVYMSPQQMMGEKPAVTDDIYSLGATLYELLTGKPPFHSGNIVLQVQSKVPPSIADRRRELEVGGEPVPPEWEETIAACLAKEPKERPQSAAEVWEMLEGKRLKDGRPEGLKSVGAETGVGRPETPQARQVGSAAPGAAAGERAGTSPTAGKSARLAGIAAAIVAVAVLGWYFGIHKPERDRLEAEAAQQRELARIADERKRAQEAAERKRLADEEAERKRLADAEAARLAAARGGIAIRTEPTGAEVRVGALALDRSPMSMTDVKLGKYPVRVRMAGYEDFNGEVEVKENEFADPGLIRLVRLTGSLGVTSTPSGVPFRVMAVAPESSAEGPGLVAEGRTPVQSLSIPTGKHEVVFDRAGWGTRTQPVVIGRGAIESIAADLRGGSVEVQSDPPGATISAQGRVVGKAPVALTDLPWDSATKVAAELPLHAPSTREVKPRHGESLLERLTLTRLLTRVRLTGLPSGLSGPIKAAWAGRELPVGAGGIVELPPDGGAGRLSVSYGPTIWEKDVTVGPGQTVDVQPDLTPRFDLSDAPRRSRAIINTSVVHGSFRMTSSEVHEYAYRRRSGNRWEEFDLMILSAKSANPAGNDIYYPGTTYRFLRSGAGWNVETISGGFKANPSIKPLMPYCGTASLNDELLPTRPVSIDEVWEFPPEGVAHFGAGLLRSATGHVRGRISGAALEDGRKVTRIVYDFVMHGQPVYASGNQTIKGTLEFRALMNEGWVKYVSYEAEIVTDGGSPATTSVVVVEEPID